MIEAKTKINDQYLTFLLAQEEYGIEILNVVEIRGWEKTTPLPSSPHYVRGVINLRGNIIPIIDLREKFKLPTIAYGPSTVVIVLQIASEGIKRLVGIVVDGVSDVYTFKKDDIKAKPDIYNNVDQVAISGLASIALEKDKTKLIILLEVNKLFDLKDFSNITQTAV